MNIYKVSIEGKDIPIQKGILKLVNLGKITSVEVELEVHPTVVNFIHSLSYITEKVTLLSKHNTEVNGYFDIHTGKSSILLVGNPNEVEGIDHLSSVPYEKNPFPLFNKGEGVPLDNELKIRQTSLPIYILQFLLDNEIKDEGNRVFVRTLLDKLKKGEKLNSFDQYIKDELSYLVEGALASAR